MTPAVCPYGPLCERDLTGPGLEASELARLEEHLSQGCPECEQLIESHLAGEGGVDAELHHAIGRAVDEAAERMAPARAAVLQRVDEELRRERNALLLRLRRRNLRAMFYVTNLAALVLLLVAYVGTAAVLRVQRRGAQALATSTEVSALAAALARYVKDGHAIPQDPAALFAALSSPSPQGAPYYRLEPSRAQAGQYLDDFGRPYRFVPGPGRALIYSLGIDGKDADGDPASDDLAASVHFVQ